jgi:hypothetical protein
VRREVGQQVGAGGCAELVVDDVQRLALGRQLEHGAREVAAARGINPARAQDQMAAAAGADGVLAVELGAAVHRQRRSGRVLGARRMAAAVEHIVGAVVHQPGALRRRRVGQHARRFGVDGRGELGFGLGFVHRGVRGGIDDHVRPQRAHRVRQALRLREVGVVVGAVEVERRQLAQQRQRALQLPADLPSLAEQHDLHHQAPYCLATQSR